MSNEDYTSYLCRTRGHHWSSTWKKPSGPPWEELVRCRRPGCGAIAMDRVEVVTDAKGDTIPRRRFFLMVAGEHRELPTTTYEVKTTTYEIRNAKSLESQGEPLGNTVREDSLQESIVDSTPVDDPNSRGGLDA